MFAVHRWWWCWQSSWCFSSRQCSAVGSRYTIISTVEHQHATRCAAMCDPHLSCLQYYFILSSVCLKTENRNILYWPFAVVLMIYLFFFKHGNDSLFHIFASKYLVGQYLHRWVMAWKCPCDIRVSVVVTVLERVSVVLKLYADAPVASIADRLCLICLIYSEEVPQHRHVCLPVMMLLTNDSRFIKLFYPSHSDRAQNINATKT